MTIFWESMFNFTAKNYYVTSDLLVGSSFGV